MEIPHYVPVISAFSQDQHDRIVVLWTLTLSLVFLLVAIVLIQLFHFAKEPQSLPVVRPLPETPTKPPTTSSVSHRHGKSSINATHANLDEKVATTPEAQDVVKSPPSHSEPQEIIPHVPELHTNPPDAIKLSGAEKHPTEPHNCNVKDTIQHDQQSTIMPEFSNIVQTPTIVNEDRARGSPPRVAPAPSTLTIASGETEDNGSTLGGGSWDRISEPERSALNLAQQLIYNRKSPEAANAKWTDVNAAGWCELNNIVVEELEAAAVYQRAFARNDELVARLHDMESRIETLCSHA
ncbi:uncharacterized protein BKA78DRAFT_349415 [Phyllosticta capitalensis]|uniref:uncharacterized protein n=1 Tax=Phyllosticta capitalensis TaxID=121624 RepID=UPI00312EEA70